MKVAFLFPGSGTYEALDNWVRTLARHCRKHELRLARRPQECEQPTDCVLFLTETRTYPKQTIESDIRNIREMSIPFGVVHNHEKGVLARSDYPSFCWTQQAQRKLKEYKPVLLRQPVLPPRAPQAQVPLHIGTFGHCEPKKCTLEMALWAKKSKVRFTVFTPDALIGENQQYIDAVTRIGADVVVHPWFERIEELAPLVKDISHFLFVLPESKGGTGGSPTSPRYAGFFYRPVIVIDDETTFASDKYHVFGKLDHITKERLEGMGTPSYTWSPDAYVDALAEEVLRYWRKA